MRRVILTLFTAAVLSTSLGCGASLQGPPPNLSPVAQKAYRATQALQIVDMIRDVAVDANGTKDTTGKPLLSDESTRAIVQYHEQSIKLINASATGWPSIVYEGLDAVQKQLLPAEKSLLGHYFDLGLATLKGFLP